MRLPLLLCLLSVALLVQAESPSQAYKRIGPDGVVEFSDVPGADASAVEISPPVTYQAPPLPVVRPRAPVASAAAPAPAPTLVLNTPRDDEPLVNTAGQVTLAASVDPAPPPEAQARFRFLLDGAVVATESQPRAELENVDRGTHQVRVQLVDAQGKVLAESEAITFHLIRPSVNLPGRR